MGSIEVNKEFFINGNKVKIISGAVHYFRIVPEYWRDTLLDLKAMGCNTVETYVIYMNHIKENMIFRVLKTLKHF